MAAVRIENRAQLIYLLTEAAELEHNVLCAYLFAMFTTKREATEGLTPDQLSSVARWRSVIRGIAIQEMAHLASACNLLTAVGGAPQLRRPNLPTSPRAYPSAFQLCLVPFGIEALDQFVFLERPESSQTDDRLSPVSSTSPFAGAEIAGIFSSERNYETLGELYRGIEDGLTYLAQKLGDENLFIGGSRVQTADAYFGLPGLIPVQDLDSALTALQVIIEQGEGATLDTTDSHYKKFVAIRDEYADMIASDPDFKPGRPVLRNPYAMLPMDLTDAADVNLVDDLLSAQLCNLFDGCYELIVQVLGRLFVHAEESEDEFQVLANTAVGLMADVIEPLGSAITLLPAGPSHPGLNAGPSFRLSRGASIPTHREAARFVFHERFSELAAYCRFLESQGPPSIIADVRGALSGFAAEFVRTTG